MTLVEKERLCQRELDELRHLIDLDLSAYPADVEATLRFIHAHLFDESLNASLVQRQEGLRSHNLATRFKRHLGLGIRAYIEDRRIMAAMRLLWQEEIEIYLIAAAVGYAHHETFTRAFKRRVGRTPSQFRAHFAHIHSTHDSPDVPTPEASAKSPSDENSSVDDQPKAPPDQSSPRLLSPAYNPLMFITDVIGIHTLEGTHDLRISGTAGGIDEVHVHAAAEETSLTQIADVSSDGNWVVLFSGEDVFSCGKPLRVEAGYADRALVHWEGPLECAEVAPRRSARNVAVTETVEAGEHQSSNADGGTYARDAAMTVTVAAKRGGEPPPVEVGDEEEVPYYERTRKPPPPRRAPDASAPEANRNMQDEVSALRAQIEALTQTVGRDTTPVAEQDAARTSGAPSNRSERGQSSDDLRREIEALRNELRSQTAQKTSSEERPDAESAQDKNESDDDSPPAWREELHSLKEEIASLRTSTSHDEMSGDPEHDGEETENEENETGETKTHDDSSKLHDTISALRERIDRLERKDEEADGAAPKSPSSSREASDSASREGAHAQWEEAHDQREEAHDQRSVGVLARQRDNNALAPNPQPSSRGLRHADTPLIKFEPFELGDWTGEGQREVRVRARITHPSRQPVAAELANDRDDRVLADGRSERGTLTLDEWVELDTGTTTFTVTVTEPAPARMSMAWTLERRKSSETRDDTTEDEDTEKDEAGWVSRAIGGAWALTVALFLLSLAAGVHGVLRGVVAAGFLGFLGSYLALTVPHRWGVWTAAGIGLFVLSLITLLPFTPIVQMDSYLVVAGLATLGLAASAVVALFVSSDNS